MRTDTVLQILLATAHLAVAAPQEAPVVSALAPAVLNPAVIAPADRFPVQNDRFEGRPDGPRRDDDEDESDNEDEREDRGPSRGPGGFIGDRIRPPPTKETDSLTVGGKVKAGQEQSASCKCTPYGVDAEAAQSNGILVDGTIEHTKTSDTTGDYKPHKKPYDKRDDEEEDDFFGGAFGGGHHPKPPHTTTTELAPGSTASILGFQAGSEQWAKGPTLEYDRKGNPVVKGGQIYNDAGPQVQQGICKCPPNYTPVSIADPVTTAPITTSAGVTDPVVTGGPITNPGHGGGHEGEEEGGHEGGEEGGHGGGKPDWGHGNGNDNSNSNSNKNKNENENTNINKNTNVNYNDNINKNLGFNFNSGKNGWGPWYGGSKAAAIAASPAIAAPAATGDVAGAVSSDPAFVPAEVGDDGTGAAAGIEQFTGAASSIAFSAWGLAAAFLAVVNVL